jgi:hypothetical protein
MTEQLQVFAILRFDKVRDLAPEVVTVKEIVPTLEQAEAEVRRLNKLNAHHGARYAWQATRYYPSGRAIHSATDDER